MEVHEIAFELARMVASSAPERQRMNADPGLLAAQAGDPDAFGALYHAHVGRIFALCLRLVGDTQRAEELTQDVFVRAWARLASYRGESAFATWLHRLAVNVVLTDRRTTWRRSRRFELTDDPEAFERVHDWPEGVALDLEAAIGRLPAGARTVFVLHDVEGFTHDEIAGMTRIAAGTSKAQLFRARRLLRKWLER
jgi:RNA polymerase sigma-70 factor (ECF subfamily)